MSNKQWFIFFVTNKHGMDRYLLEHYIVPEFESVNQYTRWQNMMRDYFRKRTGVTGGQVVAIEPSDISTAFKFDAGAAGEAIR